MADSTGLPNAPTAEHRTAPTGRLTAEQEYELRQHVETIRVAQAKSLEAAEAIAAIFDRGLFVASGTFEVFAKETFGYGKSRAYQLAKAGQIYAAMKAGGVDPLPTNESQLRPLSKLHSEDDRHRIWLAVAGPNGADSVSREDVEGAVLQALGASPDAGYAGTAIDEASDPVQVGLYLLEVRRTMPDAHDFEAFLRRELGRDPKWANTMMNYATLCEALGDDQIPSEFEFSRYEMHLRPLAVRDQAAVWRRVADSARTDASGRDRYTVQAVKAAVLDVTRSGLKEVGLPPLLDGGAKVEGAEHAAEERPFTVALDVSLMPGELRSQTEESGTAIAPNTVLVPYDQVPDGAVGATTEAMREEKDMPAEATIERKRLVLFQRQMVRIGFEPDLATWAWPVLVPAPNRFARQWLPIADAPAPCFVPRRLLQSSVTKRNLLSVADRAKKDAGTYLVDDNERNQSRVVLLAPGVDLVHEAVPADCIRTVLDHAAEATDFIFLTLALDHERVASTEWPGNVFPVTIATDAAGWKESVLAFASAGCRGVVALMDFAGDFDVGHEIDPGHLRDHVAAVLVRGKQTSRRALQDALALRRYGVRIQVGRDVTVNEVEPVFDPASFQTTDASDSGNADSDSRPTGTKRAVLPGRGETE